MLYHGGTSIHVVVQLIAPRKYSKIDKIKTTKCMGTSSYYICNNLQFIHRTAKQAVYLPLPPDPVELELLCCQVLQHFYHPYQFAKNNYDT